MDVDWECRNCQEFNPLYNELAKELSSTDSQVKLGKLDATKYRHLAEKHNVGRLPALLYFRKRVPLLYTGNLAVDSISIWLDENRKSFVRRLDEDNFEHLTQASTGATTGDWLIQFASPGCEACKLVRANWEAVASHLRRKMNIATVDLSVNQGLARRFKIHQTPTVILFRHGSRYTYKTHNNDYTFYPIVAFATEDYRKVKAVTVEGKKGFFSELWGSLSFNFNIFTVLYICFALIAIVIVVACVCACKLAAEDNIDEANDEESEDESDTEDKKEK
ncbi:uncharacterized protein TRIADDRAFT_55148 [Trichoplax adhaerens]|uniref:Thioredoxin domain-containing protein n=1 Tax=Trichoplax adhaerens TaxID=10228 RepID=B3RU42_TRIAD|nr:hypothetical protein TRIADDRAFT_55148 [Trichoplax adhaerens]EDV25278.1 hypothetical protein TRIADDRAFT_55148 [Trichoplax adhaerens]|eukprot:XP_002111311.1 hypothetical protein TRIADDRAFT_55148 [Trichoplax adhaerens]